MKVLWIEDFGVKQTSKLIIEIFRALFKDVDLSEIYDSDNPDVASQLRSLFAKHTLHEIYVCRSYVEWKEVDEKHNGDFDVALIDINLESYDTPREALPDRIDSSQFDKKAGFYIYHQLIKRGFPDSNIAFFTAEKQSLTDFTKYCGDIFLDSPAHCFEKKSTHFQRLRQWLAERANEESLSVRRGILEGCNFMKNKIEEIDRSGLESRLILYKTMPAVTVDNPEALRHDAIDYLTSLEHKFVSPQRRTGDFYLSFIRDLSAKWVDTKWSYMRHKPAPQFKERLEEQFQRTAHFQMKMLRNWSNHGLLSSEVRSKEVAYFFMLAMRTLMQSDLNEVPKYEQILSTLFDGVSESELTRSMRSILPFHLERSYEELRIIHKELLRLVRDYSSDTRAPHNLNRRIDNHFLGIFRESGEFLNFLEKEGRSERGEQIKLVDPGILAFYRRRLREISVRMFYHSFWHGLFPLQIKTISYADLQRLKFYIEPFPDSFLSFLGQTIFAESFKEDLSVSVA